MNRVLVSTVFIAQFLWLMPCLASPVSYNYVKPGDRSFSVPAPEQIHEVARKWRKQSLGDIQVKLLASCPLSAMTDGAIAPEEKALEITFNDSEMKVYLCSNYRRDYQRVEYETLHDVLRIMEQKDENVTILKYSLATYKGRTFNVLTGYSVLQPPKFSRSYALPGEQECCEADTPDRMIMAPLRLVSAKRFRRGETKCVRIKVPRFNEKMPGTFVLCTDQARSVREEKEIQMDESSLIWHAGQYDKRDVLISYALYNERRGNQVIRVRRVTGLEFLPIADYKTRVRARMAGGMGNVTTQKPGPTGGICRQVSGGLITRISCERMTKAELKSRKLGENHDPEALIDMYFDE